MSGYADFQDQIESGRPKVAVSAGEPVEGIDVPTLVKEGNDVSLTNWRGVVAPSSITDEKCQELEDIIAGMITTDTWVEPWNENSGRRLADRRGLRGKSPGGNRRCWRYLVRSGLLSPFPHLKVNTMNHNDSSPPERPSGIPTMTPDIEPSGSIPSGQLPEVPRKTFLNGRGSLLVAGALALYTAHIIFNIITVEVPDSAQSPGPKFLPRCWR